jgi:hypothetical protein
VYDRCLVGVVTNIDPELHFGEFYIDSPEKVWNVFRTQVDLVLSSGSRCSTPKTRRWSRWRRCRTAT